jgi:hypothetical protein
MIDKILKEWSSKKRHMGCVSAAKWFCKRDKTFSPKRLTRFTSSGDLFQHVVVTNGIIVIDLVPHRDRPDD